MPYDAGFTAATVREIQEKAAGAKVEKCLQPEKDEIVLVLRRERETHRLALNAGAGSPKMYLTGQTKENPLSPPMFCMLLRKHLVGGRLTAIRQMGFDRVAELTFACYDEMGFPTEKYIYIEIMGKHSNMMLCDASRRVIYPLHVVDFTASSKRQVLPGMAYELPPSQGRMNPLEATREQVAELCSAKAEMPVDKLLMSSYDGLSSLAAREICYRACRSVDAPAGECDPVKLWMAIGGVLAEAAPCMIRSESGAPLDYAFFRPRQYENSAVIVDYPSFGELVDAFFAQKDKLERMRQKSHDILRLLSATSSRLTKKINAQLADLAACEEKEQLRLWGELITSNIYRLKKGDKIAEVEDYYAEDCPTVAIPMDERLTPAQNAQKYFRKYTKLRTAEEHLLVQLRLAREELGYIDTVFDSLTRADTEKELSEIREELESAGYAGRLRGAPRQPIKGPASKPLEFVTTGGFRVLCGKNNRQNDYITTKLAEREDWWFHIKNFPGSHVLMVCEGREPGDQDFTQAAQIAAYHSKPGAQSPVGVDYTQVRYLKKPAASKPGFVTYEKYYSAFVSATEEEISALKRNAGGH